MEVADVSNDTRGWIMCIVSGIACVMGACVICVDLVIRYIPGKQDFRIQDSNSFLACSLSLSFGVMIFSALHSMLPESEEYLRRDKYDSMDAGLIMMVCFVGGFLGIQGVSRLLHRVMPSHVVDCDHTHDDADGDEDHAKHDHSHGASRQPSRIGRARTRLSSQGRRITTVTKLHENGHSHGHPHVSESTPLLPSAGNRQANGRPHADSQQNGLSAVTDGLRQHSLAAKHSSAGVARRPSLIDMRDRVLSFVKDTKRTCDVNGPCFGYSDPCGQECFKHLSSRSAISRQNSRSASRMNTSIFQPTAPLFERVSEEGSEVDSGAASPLSPLRRASHTQSQGPTVGADHHDHHHHDHQHDHHVDEDDYSLDHMSEASTDLEAQDGAAHHHHVPANAFLSIGLQTVIAIALHKFPEGFITYATNHANPQLGFNVFMALFVHNIAEGFAMALPLYMALGSRLKAIAWSSLLGGFSQPMGAGIAWLVFRFFGSGGEVGIDNTAYAILFAATAGIMASVALQLFVESLSLDHNRNLSIAFAFLGMVLLGVSNAIAGHH
ncbi:putative zip zinc transporter [Diaporthe ampelina]|uniref:Putative zip zinc transporter n=1 Tax=Diaporthe ampelina TaxID=1214573 RepID=A0A0G2HLS5_9PEZI|nr:putative zip zinc transporter [Diaporthe ampelina]